MKSKYVTALAFELTSMGLLLGSLVGGGAYLAWRLHATKRDMRRLDLTDVLVVADARLDVSIRACLADGTILLVHTYIHIRFT